MNHCIIIISFLVTLSHFHLGVHANEIFSKNSTIAHPETGLFLDYVGLYAPAEQIIHISAIFPMTKATCYFLPLSAAHNIPSCNITKKKKRNKRFVDIISLGIGSASLGMSISNSVQIASLQQQVAVVENSLSQFSQTVKLHGAQLAKITLKQIELTEELQLTQKALNAIIPVLDTHSKAINTLKTGIEQLHVHFQRSFLYLAMTQIFRNELTLDFFSPEDMHKVVYGVMKQGNLTFNSYYESLPIVQIVTNLLVRQQIDFVSSAQYITMNPEEIGRLVITSFFAVPRHDQIPFYIYKLLTIPFFHQNNTIQLAQIPQYWAINPENNTTMEWYEPEEFGCRLQLMTSCRDSPPIRTVSNGTCLGQIMGRLSLSQCHTATVPNTKYLLRQLRDNFWITSTPKPIHCLKIPKAEYLSTMQATWSMNEEIILPSVALVNVTPGYTVACPGFTLVGRPLTPNASSLIIMSKTGVFTANISVLDVHEYIVKNITWFKNKAIDREMKDLKDFIYQTSAFPSIPTSFSKHIWPYSMLITSWILIGLSVGLVYYIFRFKRRVSLLNP